MVNIERGSSPSRPPARAVMSSSESSQQNISANLKVVVRVRPMNEKELNSRVVVDVANDRMLVMAHKEETQPFFNRGAQQPKGVLKRANKELKYVFDHVCDMNTTNDVVFEETTKEMLSSLTEGYNCAVFVYGATGAGKTYTMMGNSDSPGITLLTMDQLFGTIQDHEKDIEFEITVSYIEVYNENVYDLLKPTKKPLQLQEDNKSEVMVAGLTQHSIKTAQELLNMLEDGNKNRTKHPTDANADSSRSHAVFQVYLKMRYKTTGQLRIVKLSMIDLAGSERIAATSCIGDRFKEGANINKSLLSLGNCINRLADGSKYIPYRDSKLTRLLKDSLGGNCKTVMIANISPSSASYGDTYNTLQFAARACKVRLTIKKNVVEGDKTVSQYVKINEELNKKIKELEAKRSISETRPVKVARGDTSKEKAKLEYRCRIKDAEEALSSAESTLLAHMSAARVLALRRRLRTRAAPDCAELAHRSSDAMEQRCTDKPVSERAAMSGEARGKVQRAWDAWDAARTRLTGLLDRALRRHPDLTDFVHTIRQKSEIRQLRARDELRYKLLAIENAEISMISEYLSDMPSTLEKVCLTLEGYDKAPSSLTKECLEVMKKSKAIGMTWSNKDSESVALFKAISTLDLHKPHLTDYDSTKLTNTAIDVTYSVDLPGTEVRSAKKRKCSPIKGTEIQKTNLLVDLSDPTIKLWDVLRTKILAKKMEKHDKEPTAIDAKDVNSTLPVRRVLADGSNMLNREHRAVTFSGRARIVKPVARPKPVRLPTAGSAPSRPAPGLVSVGLKAVHPRDASLHPRYKPYTRLAPSTTTKTDKDRNS